jgi:hypothetical protein
MDYKLTASNKRLWEFYNEHPNLDFEDMNLLFIDVLAKIIDVSNPSLNSSIASQLVDSLKTLQSQVAGVSDMMSKSQIDMTTSFTMKFIEFKRDYIADLQMILSSNTADRVAPIIKECNDALLDKTRIMLGEILPKNKEALSMEIENSIKSLHSSINIDTDKLVKGTITKDSLDLYMKSMEDVFSRTILNSQTIFNSLLSSSESRIDAKLSELKDISKTNSLTQTSLQTNVGELLRKMENSASKGRLSENILYSCLHSLYPTAQIDFVGTTKESGDIMMFRKDKPTILFENKNYDKNVTQDEVRKFLRDVELKDCSAILLAQHYGITNKANFEIELNNNNVLLYLHKVEYDADKIKAAVDIIDHFKRTLGESEHTSSETLSIDKEVLDEINREYQIFTTNRLSHIKMIKDYNQKLIAQAEDLKIPNLEIYLSKLYASSSSKNDVCEHCDYAAKNARALVAHHRGCLKKKAFDASLAPTNIVVVCNNSE